MWTVQGWHGYCPVIWNSFCFQGTRYRRCSSSPDPTQRFIHHIYVLSIKMEEVSQDTMPLPLKEISQKLLRYISANIPLAGFSHVSPPSYKRGQEMFYFKKPYAQLKARVSKKGKTVAWVGKQQPVTQTKTDT